MDGLKIAVTWFAFGAVIGIAMLLQPIVAPILPKDPGDRLVYVFQRGLAYAGGQAAKVELTDAGNGLVVEKMSISRELDGREIGFFIDRLTLDDVATERLVNLYLGRNRAADGPRGADNAFAGRLHIDGLELRTGQDYLHVETAVFRNVGAEDYRQWFDPEAVRDGSYGTVLSFLVLAGTADQATAENIFFRNESTIPISASIEEIRASELAAGQVGQAEIDNAVAQWRVGNGVTVQSVSIRTFNAREIVSAVVGHDNDLAAPEALIIDLAEFQEFSLHTPDIEILRIPSGTVATYTQLGRIPVSARIALQETSLEVDALSSKLVRDYLRDVGIGAISADVSLAYIFDRQSGLLTIKDGAITAPDIATVDLNAELSGINPSWDAIADFVAGLQQSQIVAASAQYEDHSLVARLSEKWAKDTSRRPEDFISSLTTSTAAAGAVAPKVSEAASALERFLGDPSRLTIAIAPETPVPLVEMLNWSSPERYLENLAIDISVEQAADGQILPN